MGQTLKTIALIVFVTTGVVYLWRWARQGFWLPRYVHALALGAGVLGLSLAALSHSVAPVGLAAWVATVGLFPALVYLVFVFYGGAEARRGRYVPIASGDHDLVVYPVGVKAGESLTLVQELAIVDEYGDPSGVVHSAGEMWRVTMGLAREPDVIWLRAPNGEMHTWDADDLFVWFQPSGPAS